MYHPGSFRHVEVEWQAHRSTDDGTSCPLNYLHFTSAQVGVSGPVHTQTFEVACPV